MSKLVIETKKVKKTYNQGRASEVTVVRGISLGIEKGDFVAIMGPSGSGKTTLLDIMGLLLRPTAGTVLIDGLDTEKMSDSELARIRGKRIGFVFQQYNLIPSSTALENVEISLRINGKSRKEARIRATKLLKMVGLSHRLGNKPGQLSGGEQQRVAIARALANDPSIILADEPTGNLDTKTGGIILDLLTKLNKKGYTIVLISHDPHITKYADTIIRIKDGELRRSR